jgi:hypothetical protein
MKITVTMPPDKRISPRETCRVIRRSDESRR